MRALSIRIRSAGGLKIVLWLNGRGTFVGCRYANAGPKELWETFDYVLYDVDYEIEIDVMVNNSMYLWTEQSGYPLVTIASGDDGSVIVTQVKCHFRIVTYFETDDDDFVLPAFFSLSILKYASQIHLRMGGTWQSGQPVADLLASVRPLQSSRQYSDEWPVKYLANGALRVLPSGRWQLCENPSFLSVRCKTKKIRR